MIAATIFVIYVAFCALCNCARGRKLFGLTGSTEIGRIVSMLGIALATGALFLPNVVAASIVVFASFPLLLVWSLLGWDDYWSAEIGHDPAHSKMWGLWKMTERMLAIFPALAVVDYAAFIFDHNTNPWWAAGVLTMGLPYLAFGALVPKNPIIYAELAVGAIIGITNWNLAGGFHGSF